MKFRNLTEKEIEVRVQRMTKDGLFLLLYKDARCDMRILDETVGVERWQREHYDVDGKMFCRVGIFFDNLGWVWKSDCGSESNAEAEKGESSDSFKRCCVNFGIGRELYTSPVLFVPVGQYTIKDGKCYDKFKVEKIRVENDEITAISILNKTLKKRVIVWQKENEK